MREAARIGGVRPLINLNSMYFNGSTGHWSMPDVPQGTVADIYIYIYIDIFMDNGPTIGINRNN